ncbi:hypothetical protein BD769DRAFT_1382657 [Suillus cothurnatus]|nr:hypothetical protein BD769DRAFT_1382657 [Suillus cothurnatus]
MLSTEKPSSKKTPPVERAGIVQGYLSSGLNFLHKIEIVNGFEITHFLEADYLMNMIVDVIWQEGLYPNIDLENLNCVFSLVGAAVHNAIKAYHEVTNCIALELSCLRWHAQQRYLTSSLQFWLLAMNLSTGIGAPVMQLFG